MFRKHHFIFLWFVTIITTLAIELFTITILVAIFEQTESTLQAAGALIARTLPAFLLGPIAGVLVDRFRRKNVLVSMDLIRVGLVGLSIGLLQSSENLPIIAMYLILTGLSAADVFHRPARIALIPSLVSQTELVKANSFILVSSQIAMAISYSIGGWLILSFSLSQIAVSIIVMFGLAILVALLIVVPQRKATDDTAPDEPLFAALISGWHYLRQHPIARPLTIMETVEHVPHGIWTGALMLTFTKLVLQGDATDFGYQSTSYFSGMIIGSVAAMGMSNWLSRFPGWIIIVNAFLAGLFTFGYALSPTVLFAVVMAFIFGPPFAVRDVAQDALLQGTVEADQLGRVYATREMLRNVVFMLSGLFFAWLTEFMPIRMIYLSGGVMYLLTAMYAFSNKALRESRMALSTESVSST